MDTKKVGTGSNIGCLDDEAPFGDRWIRRRFIFGLLEGADKQLGDAAFTRSRGDFGNLWVVGAAEDAEGRFFHGKQLNERAARLESGWQLGVQQQALTAGREADVVIGQDFLPKQPAFVVAALVEDLDPQGVTALVQRKTLGTWNQGGQGHGETGGSMNQGRPGGPRWQ